MCFFSPLFAVYDKNQLVSKIAIFIRLKVYNSICSWNQPKAAKLYGLWEICETKFKIQRKI